MDTIKRVLTLGLENETSHLIEKSLFSNSQYHLYQAASLRETKTIIQKLGFDLILLGDKAEDCLVSECASVLKAIQPLTPVILIAAESQEINNEKLLCAGLTEWLQPPLNLEMLSSAVNKAVQNRNEWRSWIEKETRVQTGQLLEKVDELETLTQVGRTIASKLDLDNIFEAVLNAAVLLTKADEATILFYEEQSNNLFMRAAKNFNEEFVRTFRIKVSDALAGEVIRSGQPVHLNAQEKPQKIKTSYLVQALIYVPMLSEGKVIGVLGVDNQQDHKNFSPRDVRLLQTLADYAVVAFQNNRLLSETDHEKNKLSEIIGQIEDGVLVVDLDGDVKILNKIAQKALGLPEGEYHGKHINTLLPNKEWQAIIEQPYTQDLLEIKGIDKRWYEVRVRSVTEIGAIVSLYDITNLKELSNLKTDLVHTVSHDLRTPLTASFGFLGMLSRVGHLNEEQKLFIENIQTSLHAIQTLSDHLLEAGKLENQSVLNLEQIQIVALIESVLKNFKTHVEEKSIIIIKDFDNVLPPQLGDPLQLRQMLENLISNAVKYTPVNGKIKVLVRQQGSHAVIQIIDSGIGISAQELGQIFEKFYRARNVDPGTPGTGLGLSIVKKIVDNHKGKIDVESQIGKGSSFTVYLPMDLA